MLKQAGRTLTVGGRNADFQGFTSAAIQAAVEELRRAGDGGTIRLDEGVYRMIGPVRLYDGITLQGSGSATVLRKSPGVQTKLTADADYGELQAEVEDASGFEVGMGIQVYDESQHWGWDESNAVITRIEGNLLYFDRHLERDYQADDGGMLTNACSVIEVLEGRQVRILDLTVDGAGDRNYPIGGCRGGGIYLYKSGDCRLENVTVDNFNGDGISWQITEHIAVRSCTVTRSAGSGLHPGAGSTRSIITDCTLEHNGLAGLFICWRVRFGEFSRNRICANGSYGICIGHKDSYNLFEDNVISGNGDSGVYYRLEKPGNGANGNRWHRNVIEDNGGAESGGYGIFARGVAEDNVFIGNRIGEDPEGRQRIAVQLADTVSGFTFE
ncbi:hypothetical protein GZH47_20125 [Paenibacillus rhizovicinus]|uniref:Right handed beta helix domain-containing protein n=1 Tax=Paenibacillus rhizovicinus TaxID=2704463 RepID=A0A6C0P335_9BACL|nr:right-handed parallel beta-helix repeat-containing protein [Paenibacillus rhizovicinus]QHW32889.1 hypothetical protein GZH47_20125 [Paenibacillus rhizovicinus]